MRQSGMESRNAEDPRKRRPPLWVLLDRLRWNAALTAAILLGGGGAIFAIASGSRQREGAVWFMSLGFVWAVLAVSAFVRRARRARR
jgi:hypothetical protein